MRVSERKDASLGETRLRELRFFINRLLAEFLTHRATTFGIVSMFQTKFLSACLVLLVLSLSQAATAGVIISMSPSSQNVQQGGSGYELNFSMTTSDPIDLGGFNVTVTVPNTSGITFTGGDSSVANYVFAGNSSGLIFNNPSGSFTGDISDLPNTLYPSLSPGTYSLGRMFFSVISNATLGNVDVTLDLATSFTSGVLPFDQYDYTPSGGSTIGTINVGASGNLIAVPEPSTLVIIMLAAGCVLLSQQRRVRIALV